MKKVFFTVMILVGLFYLEKMSAQDGGVMRDSIAPGIDFSLREVCSRPGAGSGLRTFEIVFLCDSTATNLYPLGFWLDFWDQDSVCSFDSDGNIHSLFSTEIINEVGWACAAGCFCPYPRTHYIQAGGTIYSPGYYLDTLEFLVLDTTSLVPIQVDMSWKANEDVPVYSAVFDTVVSCESFTTDIGQTTIAPEISIYPNPLSLSSGQTLQIKSTQMIPTENVSYVDMQGRVSQYLPMTPGLYLVQLKVNNKIIVKKLILQP